MMNFWNIVFNVFKGQPKASKMQFLDGGIGKYSNQISKLKESDEKD